MRSRHPLQDRWLALLENLRLRLSSFDALPQLALLGLLSGSLAGGVTIAFRLMIESAQASLLPGGQPENYEGLTLVARFLAATSGGLTVGLALQLMHPNTRRVGVVHVMERLAYHQGHLPLANALVQFFAGAASIICGHSVGREGPGVHLGAASGSLLGQWLHLPNNSIRTLVACGVAASIGASFNTPLAGVIFAMEVVMMEYTLAGFAPVILAAVSATSLSRLVFGSDPAFIIPALTLASLTELPYVLLLGLTLGALAAAFIQLLQLFVQFSGAYPIWSRCLAGGALVGLCALAVPEVMGIGYDTVNGALTGNYGIAFLLGVTLMKLFATAASVGCGLPGGLIGPCFIIGSTAGGVMGLLAQLWFPGNIASPGFYALIGMGTMMGATLQAPLAALTAMLELTANPNIILPGMLALITAGLVSKEVFDKDSVFLHLIRTQGLDYRNDPVMQALRRTGVGHTMDRSFVVFGQHVQRDEITQALQGKPRWILVKEDNRGVALLPAADLVRHLQEHQGPTSVDLLAIPAERLALAPIHIQATLQQAVETLADSGIDALYVTRTTAPGIERVYGVLTRADIDRGYRL
jgi:H+/Cl- antiporter ClcA